MVGAVSAAERWFGQNGQFFVLEVSARSYIHLSLNGSSYFRVPNISWTGRVQDKPSALETFWRTEYDRHTSVEKGER